MKGRLTLISMAVIMGLLALPRCSSCWDDPDDPKVWIKKLTEAQSKDDRENALFNLYRIYELDKAMSEKEPRYKKKIKNFRTIVNPVLVDVFRKKVSDRYLLPGPLVEKMIIFEANHEKVQKLFIEIIDKYTEGSADEFGDEDLQENLAAKSVDGLARMATRGTLPAGALDSIQKMINAICRKRTSTSVKVEGLDPRSFVRNAVVKSVPNFLKMKSAPVRAKLAQILAKVVLHGQSSKSTQDPMATIFAIRLMGDVGDTSELTTQALILSLLGKGRGRRFYSFATTAVAKLPVGANGKHPATEPLLLMLKGDPWKARIDKYDGMIGEENDKKKPDKKRIKDLEAEIAPLKTAYKGKKVMPKCPYPKFEYVCKLFWQANVEEWSKSEPGVISMNALMVLREIGDLSAVPEMLKKYGIETVKARWIKAAKANPQCSEKTVNKLPGVQMQKMIIGNYGADMNVRAEMLRSLGRMNAIRKANGEVDEAVFNELYHSLSWAGDPTMLVKAGEGAYLSAFNKKLLEALIAKSTSAASYMMANFKKRQVKMFFWGKVVKGTCNANKDLEEDFKKCSQDPPLMPGQTKKEDIKDANWNCFWKYRKMWLSEFYYAIKYHQPTDYFKLIHEKCRPEDYWWTSTRKALEKVAGSGSKEAAAARLKLYACSNNPPKDALKKGETVKCGEWSVCDESNNFICLDGHWQLRMNFHEHASLLTTPEYVEELLKHTAQDLMTPHKLKVKNLPAKEKYPKKGSCFYDSDDAMYLTNLVWPQKVEDIRIKRARAILEKQLCYHRKNLWVVKECQNDFNKYINVVKGVQRIPVEDCEKLKGPYPEKVENRAVPGKRDVPTWREKLKALRMIAYFGSKAKPSSREVRNAIQAVITYYPKVGTLSQYIASDVRDMILLVIDRIGDYASQKDVMCPYPYKARRETSLREKYGIPRYEEKRDRAKKQNRPEDIQKWSDMIKKYEAKVKKELVGVTKDMPCYKMLKMVVEDETNRRVKGVWQINRDARNALGRLARGAKMRFDDI